MTMAADPGKPVFQRIASIGAVAILRADSADDAVDAGLRLIDAGFDVIEVSFNTPNAASAIKRLLSERPEALVGAGTVLATDEARSAVSAGARFLLSPAFGEHVGQVAADAELPYIPGVFTAMDVWRCLQEGFEVLKVFPAAPLGPDGMRALLEPFPQVRPLPTGGVGVDDAAGWFQAGAFALGMGGSLARTADPAAAAARLRSVRAAH